MCFVFFFKQKTAYEMRISDWSSDVCSYDLVGEQAVVDEPGEPFDDPQGDFRKASLAPFDERRHEHRSRRRRNGQGQPAGWFAGLSRNLETDRKSTRLNSSH